MGISPIMIEKVARMTNTGKPYEVLTGMIFEQALRQDGVQNLEVTHRKIVQGITAKHEIDVFWRFTAAAIEHTVLVQCKDWGDKVDHGEMLKFVGVLGDIPGQPRGLFVTRSGYQAGARNIALAHGIALYTLREPLEQDWEGMIRNIKLIATLLVPQFSDPEIVWDNEWLKAESESRGLQSGDTVAVMVRGAETDIWFYNEQDQPIENLYELRKSLVPQPVQEMPPQIVRRRYLEPMYIHNGEGGDRRFPRLKAREVRYELTVVREPSIVSDIRADDLVAFMLQDILTGAKTSIDKKLRMIRAKHVQWSFPWTFERYDPRRNCSDRKTG